MYQVYDFEQNKNVDCELSKNRGFLYGDGFFETLKVIEGQTINIKYHYSRILKGLKLLELKQNFGLPDLINSIDSFLQNSNASGRLKIVVFRENGGLYTPISSKPLFYFDFKEINDSEFIINRKKAVISEDIVNQPHKLSIVKPISATNYILVGLELKRSNAEDIIILDNKGYVSECLYSNIWWIKDKVIFTPSLKTNCIEGTARTRILEFLTKEEITHKEVTTGIKEVLKADFVFTSNSFGLSILEKINSKKFNNTNNLFEKILSSLF